MPQKLLNVKMMGALGDIRKFVCQPTKMGKRKFNVEEANINLQKFLSKEGFNIDFESCINNKQIEDFVLNDRIDGAKNFKVNATPTIIINNKKFEKTLNYKNLKKALEKLI